MKKWRAPGYKNYGMIPPNEFTTTYIEKDKSYDAVSEHATQAEGIAREPYVPKRRARYGMIRGRRRGWLRSRSTNGWRAESASPPYEY